MTDDEDQSMTPDQLKVWLARLHEEHEAEEMAVVARLRSQGREPARRDDLWGTWCPTFDFSLRWADVGSDAIELRLRAAPRDQEARVQIWGADWPEPGDAMSAGDLLAFLATSWTTLAGGFLAEGVARGQDPATVDLRAGIGRPDLAPFLVRVEGPRVSVSTGDRDVDLGSEGVILVETLMAMCDLMAARLAGLGLRDDAVSAWGRARALAVVWPAGLDQCGDGTEPSDDSRAEAAHWARRLGQDPDAYRRAAVRIVHKNWLFNVGEGPEPTSEDWDVEHLPDDLPDDAAIAAIMARGAEADPDLSDPDAYLSMALAHRNQDARSLVLYRDWPRRHVPRPPRG